MKVLVCGGRYFSDRDLVQDTLSLIHALTPITLLIHGGATGADSLAGEWAGLESVPLQVVEADWKLHGKRAGPIRNGLMLQQEPAMVIAFPGGRGTADMVRQATKKGVIVKHICQIGDCE